MCVANAACLSTGHPPSLAATDSHHAAMGLAWDAAQLKVVLNLAEITDSKHIKNHQVLFMNVIDLVLSVTWNEQHSSGLYAMHNTLNGDRPTS